MRTRKRRGRFFALTVAGSAAVLAATAASAGAAVGSGNSPAAATPTAISSAGTTALIHAYARHENIPAADIAGVRPGSVHAATVRSTGLEWATAAFTPASSAPAAIADRFQDGAAIGVFTRTAQSSWTMREAGGEPFPCSSPVPVGVRTAWGVADPAVCRSVTARPKATAGSVTPAGTTATIASVASGQVGHGDTPASTDWSLDCDPYTALVGVGASTSGCGTDSSFNVLDQNEYWCADFAKWVWEQAGVTSDLSALTPGATSFSTWAADNGQTPTFDSGTPAVGDAIVFYPSGTSTPVGSYADHVGLIVGVNSSNNTVDMVNGDFMGSSNVTVQDSGYVNIQSFADSVWGSGEEWVLVSSGLPTGLSVTRQPGDS